MNNHPKISVLFICMGNICRSPTAEAVFRHTIAKAGLSEYFLIDSAGTHDYHIGDAPDSRSQQAAKKRGYDMSLLRGRQITADDFIRFDFILAMDKDNLSILQKLQPGHANCHLGLFLDFAETFEEREVPDPYYGGGDCFVRVLDMIEVASEGLLKHLRLKNNDCLA